MAPESVRGIILGWRGLVPKLLPRLGGWALGLHLPWEPASGSTRTLSLTLLNTATPALFFTSFF